MARVDKSTKIVRSFLCRSVMMCGAWKCGYSVWKQAKNRMNLGLCATAASVATAATACDDWEGNDGGNGSSNGRDSVQ